VETNSEIHLFPYGYFCRAKLFRQGKKDVVEIQFQDVMVIAKGKNLETLCDALARLAVERIKFCPERYEALARNEWGIDNIEVKINHAIQKAEHSACSDDARDEHT
jgi:hypothetical protein